jgi:uncharacterized alpha-E superfamily protein
MSMADNPLVNDLLAATIKPATTVPLQDFSKFNRVRPPRPMLAREADAIYWMARYVERAEHVARLLLVSLNVMTDSGDLDPDIVARLWNTIPAILRLPPVDGDNIAQHIQQYVTFDASNPNSILTCLTRARENARGIREGISAEMWENLNTLYWSMRGDDAPARFDESPDALHRSVMTGSLLFQGLTDQTMAHDQRWLFTQVGKYLERIDITSRVLEIKYAILREIEPELESAERNIHWMGVLRSACSIEAYRRNNLGDMDPLRVTSFLLLEQNFPRSVRFSVRMAHEAIASIREEVSPRKVDPAERILGRLSAQLEYAEMSEVLSDGLSNYLQRIQNSVAEAALAIQKTYFLH